MAELVIECPDEVLAASGKARPELERELQLHLAVSLFESGEVSVGKAAEIAGVSKPDFLEELGRLKIPVINLDEEELQVELNAVRGNHRRG